MSCQTCGHALRHHAGLADIDDCAIPGCTCTRFEAMPTTTPVSVVRVRCAGHPGTTPPCTWTGTLGAPADEGHCPNCDGLVEQVPATTPTAVEPVAGPPPDLQQAIQAAELLRRAADGFVAISPSFVSEEVSERRARNHAALLAGADALEQLQAAQAENQRLRKANDGLYRQAIAKELRALRKFKETVFDALPVIWERNDRHALVFETIAEAHNALEHHAALGQVDQEGNTT